MEKVVIEIRNSKRLKELLEEAESLQSRLNDVLDEISRCEVEAVVTKSVSQ